MSIGLHSPVGLGDYFQALQIAFHSACHQQSVVVYALDVAGYHVRLQCAGASLTPALLPALQHLSPPAAPAHAEPDVTLQVWDTTSTGVVLPAPPFTHGDYKRYGHRAVAYAGSVALMHAPSAGMLFAYDRSVHQGVFCAADAERLSIYERAAPLQTLFHWALVDFGWHIVHAAAVGGPQGGVLLVGKTGAGKSTTALSCLGQGNIRLLSDDKCLVRMDPTPQAVALFSSGKLKSDMLEWLPHFRPMLSGWDDNSKADKGLVFLHPAFADSLIQTFPIKALVLPRVTGTARASVYPITPIQVFRELGPSTVIWLPGAEGENLHVAAEMVRRLPCYRIELATSPQANIGVIQDLLRQLC